ncbi:MAG TPA: DUF2530 domain-containing protein [Trebonia sp.]|nr:DUF2530 domain-containing protein [Trebonia sp.]
MSEDRPPSAPPKEADDRKVAAAITACWAIALIVVALLAVRNLLPVDERWWVWTCVAGFGFGLWGMWYVPLLKRRRAGQPGDRARVPAPPAQSSGDDPSSASRDSGSKTVSSTDTPGSSTRS